MSVRFLIPQYPLVANGRLPVWRCGIRNQLRQRRCLKHIDAQNLRQTGQANLQMKLFAQNGHEQINANRDPDLGLDRVIARPKEMLDAQVLFDAFEKQLNLPSTFVKLGNNWGGQVEVVGQEDQAVAAVRISEADAPEPLRVMGHARRARHPDDLIAAEPGGRVHRAGLQTLELHARLGARHKVGPGQNEAVEPAEIQVAPIHDVKRSRLGQQLIQHAHIGRFAVGNADHGWDGPAQIQERVQFDRALGGAKARRREEAQAEVDRGRVQGVDRLRQPDSDRVSRIKPPGSRDQSLGQIGVNAPVAVAVGVGQSAVRPARAKTQMIELVLARVKTGLNVRQAFTRSELGERHSQELVPAREMTGLVLALKTRHTAAELLGMNPVHHLGENHFSRMHPASWRESSFGKRRKRVQGEHTPPQPQRVLHQSVPSDHLTFCRMPVGPHIDLYYKTLTHELEGALPGTVRARLLIIAQ